MTTKPEWHYPINQNGHRSAHANRDGEVYLGEWRNISEHIKELGQQLIFAAIRVDRSNCTWCGFRPDVTFDGELVTLLPECPAVDNPIRFSVPFPSGEIVFRDDLRPVFDLPEEFDDNVLGGLNTHPGQRFRSLAAAKAGFAYGQVGNTSPNLYKVDDDDHYVIANPAYDEDTDDERVPDNWELVGGFCTDTWSYNIADAAEWDRRLPIARKEITDESRWWRGTDVPRLKVTPGLYVFTHHYGTRGFGDGHGSELTIFAEIERRDLDAQETADQAAQQGDRHL